MTMATPSQADVRAHVAIPTGPYYTLNAGSSVYYGKVIRNAMVHENLGANTADGQCWEVCSTSRYYKRGHQAFNCFALMTVLSIGGSLLTMVDLHQEEIPLWILIGFPVGFGCLTVFTLPFRTWRVIVQVSTQPPGGHQ
jgi:hypothetical protein